MITAEIRSDNCQHIWPRRTLTACLRLLGAAEAAQLAEEVVLLLQTADKSMDVLLGVFRALLLVPGIRQQHVGLVDNRAASLHVHFEILGARRLNSFEPRVAVLVLHEDDLVGGVDARFLAGRRTAVRFLLGHYKLMMLREHECA